MSQQKISGIHIEGMNQTAWIIGKLIWAWLLLLLYKHLDNITYLRTVITANCHLLIARSRNLFVGMQRMSKEEIIKLWFRHLPCYFSNMKYNIFAIVVLYISLCIFMHIKRSGIIWKIKKLVMQRKYTNL